MKYAVSSSDSSEDADRNHQIDGRHIWLHCYEKGNDYKQEKQMFLSMHKSKTKVPVCTKCLWKCSSVVEKSFWIPFKFYSIQMIVIKNARDWFKRFCCINQRLFWTSLLIRKNEKTKTFLFLYSGCIARDLLNPPVASWKEQRMCSMWVNLGDQRKKMNCTWRLKTKGPYTREQIR